MPRTSLAAIDHQPPNDHTDESAWSVHITQLEAGQMFGALPRAAPGRFRYIAVTLEYVYRGADYAELYPEAIVLMCAGASPLQGLTQTPRLFFDEDTGQVWLNAQTAPLYIDADTPHHATLVYEFHQDCREFRLYFPECDSLGVNLP